MGHAATKMQVLAAPACSHEDACRGGSRTRRRSFSGWITPDSGGNGSRATESTHGEARHTLEAATRLDAEEGGVAGLAGYGEAWIQATARRTTGRRCGASSSSCGWPWQRRERDEERDGSRTRQPRPQWGRGVAGKARG